ncbi:MAG: hypothetical protein ACKV2T_39305, partial [Kofleriaceae bacterium]
MKTIAYLALLSACTFDRPADVTFGRSAIEIVAGDHQVGVVTSPLVEVLQVKVTNGDFIPIENFTVEFTALDSDGTFTERLVRTDAQGNARTMYTLGTRAGEQRLQASGEGIESDPPVFVMTGLAAAPARLVAAEGDGSSATVASTLASPLVVRVEDAYGNAVPTPFDVTFSVTSGGGTVSEPTAASDAQGLARTQYTLGTGSIAQSVEATGEAVTPATFTITGIADVATQIEIAAGNDLLTPALVPSEPLVVRARDAYGNPASGAAIEFVRTAGDGVLSASMVTTDVNGLASTTLIAQSLSSTPHRVEARAYLAGAPLTFSARTRTFRAPSETPAPHIYSFGSLAAGDLNGDGRAEVVFNTYNSSTGSGLLVSSSSQIFLPGWFSGARVLIKDLDGAGSPEILVHSSSTLYIYPNLTPPGATTLSFGSQQAITMYGTDLIVADINVWLARPGWHGRLHEPRCAAERGNVTTELSAGDLLLQAQRVSFAAAARVRRRR